MDLLKKIHIKEIEKIKINYDINFKVGDIISIEININEKKQRQQIFKGIVISKKYNGINSTFKVKKNNNTFIIEKIFFLYCPYIKKITIINSLKVRKSKLYYLKIK